MTGPMTRSSRSSSRTRTVGVMPSASSGGDAATAASGSTSSCVRHVLDGLLEPQADLGLVELGRWQPLAAARPGTSRPSPRSRRWPSSSADSVALGVGLALAAVPHVGQPLVDDARAARRRTRPAGRAPVSAASSSTRRSSAWRPGLDRPGQALVDLGEPAAQERAAVGERGAPLVEVGAPVRHLPAAARRAGGGRRPWPGPAAAARPPRPRARGSSASSSAARSRSRASRSAVSSPCSASEVELGERVVAVGGGALGGRRWRRRACAAGGRARSPRRSRRCGPRPAAAAASRRAASAASAASAAAVGPLAGLVERGAGGARSCRWTTRQPPGPKRPPSRVTTTASGWARATSTRRRPAAVDGHGRAEQARRAAGRPRGGGAGRGRAPARRRGGGVAAGRAATPSASTAPGTSPLARTSSARRPGVDRVDHDGGEGLAAGGLDGGLPARGRCRRGRAACRRTPSTAARRSAPARDAGVVEGLAPGRRPGRSSVWRSAWAASPALLGGPGAALGRLARRGRRGDGADDARPRRQRPRAARPRRGAASASSRSTLARRLATRLLRLVGVGVGPVERPCAAAPSSPRTSAARPDGAGTPSPHSASNASWAAVELGLGLGQRGDVGAEALGLAAERVDVGLQPGGVGLEAGDHALVDERGALALDAAGGARRAAPAGPGPSRAGPRTGRGRRPRRCRPGRPSSASAAITARSSSASCGRQQALLVAQLGLGRGGVAQAALAASTARGRPRRPAGPAARRRGRRGGGRRRPGARAGGAGGAPRAAGPAAGRGCPRWRRAGARTAPCACGA